MRYALDGTFCVEAFEQALEATSHGKAARDFQHRSGLPVHQQGMDHGCGGQRSPCEHGGERTVDGQRVHRKTLASSEARGGVSVGTRERQGIGDGVGKMVLRLQPLETESGA